MNEIQLFNYNNNEIRVIERDGEPWFVAKDVCDVLELTNITEALRGLDDDELSSVMLKSGGQNREMRLINEAGLYALIFKSVKPEAKIFSKWVRSEVLPTLRRTGNYAINKEQSALPSGALEGAKLIFETAGIKGNQLTLAMDKVYKSYTGRSALAAGEIQLEAPTKRQLLTPTEIGKQFGLKARQINDILAGRGFQYKINDNWEPLKPGMKYAVMLDTNKKHTDGTPVRQLKWDSRIIEPLKRIIDSAYD